MSAADKVKAWSAALGMPDGSLGYNDTFMKYSTAMGWTGTINDRMAQYMTFLSDALEGTLDDKLRTIAELIIQVDGATWNELTYDQMVLISPPPP